MTKGGGRRKENQDPRGTNTEVQTNTEARRPTRGKGGGAKSGGQRMFRGHEGSLATKCRSDKWW